MRQPIVIVVAGLVAALLLGGGWGLAAQDAEPPVALDPPPRMVLRAADGAEQAGGEGSFCWENGCADFIGVEIPARPLEVAAGETVELDLAALGRAARVRYWLYPYRATVEQDGSSWILRGEGDPLLEGRLPRGERLPLRLDLPPGHYALEIVASFRRGDSTQGFNLLIEAPTAGGTPAATPVGPATPVATPEP